MADNIFEISKITLPNGQTYAIKDEVARAAVGAGLQIKVVDKLPAAAAATMGALYFVSDTHSDKDDIYDEYVTVKKEDSYAWEKIGNTDVDLSNYATKAHKHKVTSNVAVAAHTYTPAGTLNAPAFTGSAVDVSVSGTPTGTLNAPAFTGTEGDVSVSGKATGSVTIAVGTGDANYTPAGQVSTPTFTGKALTSSGKYTPAGEVAAPTVTIDTKNAQGAEAAVYSMASAGSVTAGEAASYTGHSFNAGELSSWNASVTGETLSFSFNAGKLASHEAGTFSGGKATVVTLPTREAITIAAEASAPAFTGKEGAVSVSGTPTGTISKPTFTGTGANLAATFAGDAFNSTGKFVPAGTVAAPVFTGKAMTATGKVTAAGTVAAPVFTGTQATIAHDVTNAEVESGAAVE